MLLNHGHYPRTFTPGFRMQPPDADPALTERERAGQQREYDFYQKWTASDFPRYLAVQVVNPTPYFDDSYAVCSIFLNGFE